MDWITGIIVFAIVAGGIYFAYWATKKVMKGDDDKIRRARKRSRRR